MLKRFGGSGSSIWKPKNPHSIDYLKYLQGLLMKNEIVTEQNRVLLVEALRATAEILIWGDQNDATVFDFFLEKQMLSYFVQILKQECGNYVCIQLLQTLNILFENIRHETSLYFLMSNNYVNSIITHRFDFSNEEIMAYYISLLKTLSMKLNSHTIHFFFNEQTSNFPLYTEAIKFFNHNEGMVRIAVRTVTLNVYRVSDQPMLNFIRNTTAVPYFSNFVWFIANHIIDVDNFVQSADNDQSSRDRLSDLLCEHLDHIHYVNDILCFGADSLNRVLTTQLLQRLFIPLYFGSLLPQMQSNTLHVSKVLSLFLLTHVFLIITHKPLVEQLLSILLFGDEKNIQLTQSMKVTDFAPSPIETITHEVMELRVIHPQIAHTIDHPDLSLRLPRSEPSSRLLYSTHMDSLNCHESDHTAFFGILLLYSICQNEAVPENLMEAAQIPGLSTDKSTVCNQELLNRLVDLLCCAGKRDNAVRLITVQLTCLVLRQILLTSDSSAVDVQIYSRLLATKDLIVDRLASVVHKDDIFIDLFENEYQHFQRTSVKIESISCDPALLLSPTNTPFSGVQFEKRLPCGPQERIRHCVRVYFHLRKFLLDLDGQEETDLPISYPRNCVDINDCLNLNNSDLLSCMVLLKSGMKMQRFLVADGLQLILVEPDPKRLGWGVVRFVGFLQDMELTGDKDDSRALHVVVNQTGFKSRPNTPSLLTAKFMFDDHIRCMAAKQRLSKGRNKARQYKLAAIADVLQVPRKDTERTASTYAVLGEAIRVGKAPGSASVVELGKYGDEARVPDDPVVGHSANAAVVSVKLNKPIIHQL